MGSYIYIASPYSHPEPFVRESRYLQVSKYVRDCLESGVCVFSPIVHCHELAKIWGLPKEADYWQEYNRAMLLGARKLEVLCLSGWKESQGVSWEIKESERQGLPIDYIVPWNYETESFGQ
ncbi:MAG: DUF1937 family protein [Patescibacteria group bacterium]|nr:DUF1937 family protein [Patescibacteria group bacterium]